MVIVSRQQKKTLLTLPFLHKHKYTQIFLIYACNNHYGTIKAETKATKSLQHAIEVLPL